jgi:hypothetical protein
MNEYNKNIQFILSKIEHMTNPNVTQFIHQPQAAPVNPASYQPSPPPAAGTPPQAGDDDDTPV